MQQNLTPPSTARETQSAANYKLIKRYVVSAVQHERGPRYSTLRRQMDLLLRESTSGSPPTPQTPQPAPIPAPRIDTPLAPIRPIIPMPLLPCTYNPMVHPFLFSPPPSPMYLGNTSLSADHPDAMNEAAARLLFLNVKWARNMPVFDALTINDKFVLLQESWKDIFLLGTAQFVFPMNVLLFLRNQSSVSARDLEAYEVFSIEVGELRPDTFEYGCLRLLLLLRTGFDERLLGNVLPKIKTPNAILMGQNQSKIFLCEVRFLNKLIFTAITKIYYGEANGKTFSKPVLSKFYQNTRNTLLNYYYHQV